MSSFAAPASPSPYPPGIENLTGDELARLAASERCRQAVRTEVSRRLKDSPNKANYLTFRWFFPADDADKADAYQGLIGCCWNATKARNRSGLFPRGYPETKQCDGYRDGGIAQETREAITGELVEYLHNLRTLSAPEFVLKALNGGFQIAANVGNALRRKVREQSKHLFQYGSDEVSADDEGDPLTLFEIVPDNPGPRTNVYNVVLKVITQEKAQIVEELGEKGWTAFEEILQFVDSESVSGAETGYSQNERDFERSLTGVFEKVYGVKQRQARTIKNQFMSTVRQIIESVLTKRLGRSDIRKRSVAEYLPPVVPMEVIRRTSRMPVISRLHWLGDERDSFDHDPGGERSSVGRDVPPDEWQKIRARMRESDDE